MERFWSKVEKTDDCWLWTANTDRDGYGVFFLGGKNRRAHRVAWELSIGPIPEGAQVHHACHTSNCVNPAHLDPMTQIVHAKWHGHSQKTHCKNGHPFEGDNLYIVPNNGKPHRACRTCSRARSIRYNKTHAARRRRQWRAYNAKRSAKK